MLMNLISGLGLVGASRLEVLQKLFGRQYLIGADDDLPSLVGRCDFVGRAHLRIGESTDDENNEARARSGSCSRHALVSVPRGTSTF